jgi:hypothetical protein
MAHEPFFACEAHGRSTTESERNLTRHGSVKTGNAWWGQAIRDKFIPDKGSEGGSGWPLVDLRVLTCVSRSAPRESAPQRIRAVCGRA